MRDQTQRSSHRELRLVHCLGDVDGPQNVDRALMDVRGDASNLARIEVILLNGEKQGIGGRMRVPAAGVVLEGGFEQGPEVTEPIRQFCRIGIV